MKKILIIALLTTLSLVSCNLKWSQENQHLYTFDDYMTEFNRVYLDTLEYYFRREIFENNLSYIKSVNADPTKTWKAGVNEFTDKTSDELKSFKGHKRVSDIFRGQVPNRNLRSKNIDDLPSSIDWRDRGVVTPVKNQSSCGSCWAFAAISNLESHIAIREGLTGDQIPSFSEQHLVDCAPNPHHCGGTGGCEGSDQPLAFDYLRKHGLRLEKDYKYKAVDQKCQEAQYESVATIESFGLIPNNDTEALMRALVDQGPISISVDASIWHNYESGVINGDCGAEINHAVVLVGYGEDSLGKFWTVRNSWGAEFW